MLRISIGHILIYVISLHSLFFISIVYFIIFYCIIIVVLCDVLPLHGEIKTYHYNTSRHSGGEVNTAYHSLTAGCFIRVPQLELAGCNVTSVCYSYSDRLHPHSPLCIIISVSISIFVISSSSFKPFACLRSFT